jgi:hypothetical protein
VVAVVVMVVMGREMFQLPGDFAYYRLFVLFGVVFQNLIFSLIS